MSGIGSTSTREGLRGVQDASNKATLKPLKTFTFIRISLNHALKRRKKKAKGVLIRLHMPLTQRRGDAPVAYIIIFTFLHYILESIYSHVYFIRMNTSSIHYFHPDMPKETHENHLPHWQADRAMYFVTWHLGDSLPLGVVKKWKQERDVWLWAHPKPWPPETEEDFHRKFSRRLEDALDKGIGSCVLRHRMYSEMTASCLRHFDHVRYHLDCFVIMPNHVHVLFDLVSPYRLEDILQQWKSVSSHRIQKHRQTSGKLWQKDSWDRMLRSPAHYKRCRNYIRENPTKAKLSEGHYVLYDRYEEF